MANLTRNMHYDFKVKINKIDSQKYRNFRVPEIDWKLNEAQDILIRLIAFPRIFQGVSFEVNQRSIDDLRTIMVDNLSLSAQKVDNRYMFTLPNDYMHHVSSKILCTKGECSKYIRSNIVRHETEFETDTFTVSSFEWEEVNILFSSITTIPLPDAPTSVNLSVIYAYTDDSFEISSMLLNYLRKPKYIHSADDAVGGTYTLPDGTVLSGYQNCELPETLHKEIVDLAVLITTGDLLADFQAKQAKMKMNN